MSSITYVLVLLLTLLAAVTVFRRVRHRQLQSRYAVLWVLLIVAVSPIALVPGLIDSVGSLVGVSYAPALLLLIAVAVLFAVSVHFSSALSKSEERVRVLAQEIALLKADSSARREEHDD